MIKVTSEHEPPKMVFWTGLQKNFGTNILRTDYEAFCKEHDLSETNWHKWPKDKQMLLKLMYAE